ncbi:MAG: PQQ-binding-like beta-propeller repeat protein [Phycisphaeraceae bacterium]|nr:PQQ-binding-like beta-propeller repeat protein [Phycisphaeraceae bacterium]
MAVLVLGIAVGSSWADVRSMTRHDGGDAGLVVLVEPVDAALATRLAEGGRHLVVALSRDQAAVDRLDRAFMEAGVHPVADAVHWRVPDALPFQDHAVNVLVISNDQSQRLGRDEVLRVIVPGHGLALVDGQELRKPRPEGMDVWLGHHRDGTGNRASRDQLDPPNSIQWIMGPRDVRRTDPHIITDRVHLLGAGMYPSDINRATLGHGRVFARDAFSGVGLWSIEHTMSGTLPWDIVTMAAAGRLYLPRAGSDEVEIRDAVTGEVLREAIPGLTWAEEVRRGGGHSRMRNAFSYRLLADGERLYQLDGGRTIRAFNLDGSERLWEHRLPEDQFTDMGATDGDNLVVVVSSTSDFPFGSQRNFTRNTNIAQAVLGLDPATGKERWRYEGVKGYPLYYMAMDEGAVVLASHMDSPHRARATPHPLYPTHAQVEGNIMVSLDAASGREHFRRTDFSDLNNRSLRQNLNVIAGRIILNEETMAYVVDLRTGRTIYPSLDLGAPRNGWNAITPNWIISNGLFVSHDGQRSDDHAHRISWPQYSGSGKPANNMYYIPPGLETINGPFHQGEMLALARRTLPDPLPDNHRMLKEGRISGGVREAAAADWPTFRGDSARRAWHPADGPANVELAWQTRIELPSNDHEIGRAWGMNSNVFGRLTPPVADATTVLVASTDGQTLHALSLKDGSERWSLNLGARVNAPPTLARGVAFVGLADGTVSAIDLERGRIIWTFLAAPAERLIQVHHQLENSHPVLTSPVLHDGVLYISAGRHGRADGGILVWALDPADGRVRGKASVTESHVNDMLQVVAGRLRLVRTDLRLRDLQASSSDAAAAPSIYPASGGKTGGAGWIRPTVFWRGYVADAGSQRTSARGSTQSQDGFGVYTRGRYHEFAFSDLDTSRNEISVGGIVNEYLAGAGRYHYVAGRGAGRDGRDQLRVAVIDTEAGNSQTVEVRVIEPGEQVVAEGIAIAHGHVIVTTTAGRVIVFREP